MNREKVKTVGFSLLAQSGQFSLEIDYIKAINTEETEGKDVYPVDREKLFHHYSYIIKKKHR